MCDTETKHIINLEAFGQIASQKDGITSTISPYPC